MVYSTNMKVIEKERARALRREGKSVNQIVREIGCSKASVSVWVRDITLTPIQKNKITQCGRSVESIERRRLSRLANEQKKSRILIDAAKKEILDVSFNDLRLIGAMLYLGEGGKTRKGTVCVANSDPLVIKIMARFLREVCCVPEAKFRAHIHTFDNANVEKTEKYWSRLTGIPRKQFYKTYIKQSVATLNKRKTLPYGTLDLSVNDTKLFLRIMGWIEKIKELTLDAKKS
jgi:hypothetical protein